MLINKLIAITIGSNNDTNMPRAINNKAITLLKSGQALCDNA
jgi:hypothetical protein